jgi:hypothetical protein
MPVRVVGPVGAMGGSATVARHINQAVQRTRGRGDGRLCDRRP